MKTSIIDLKSKGFTPVSYPPDLRSAVKKAIGSWKRFCDLPVTVKKGLPYSNNADGVGYELKDGTGNKGDRKENFDAALAGKEWLTKHVASIADPAALSFVKDATDLVAALKPTVVGFAQHVEKEFGIEGFAKEVEEGEDCFFVRFIHYFGDRKVGEETASAHTDQSGFTLHLFESDPGLQCFTYDGRWIDMPVSEGETVIIPSMQLQLRSGGDLKALCHRVIATRETAEKGRYSAVCFVQLKKTSKYDKDKHGRLQEKEPGFNYSLSQERFADLFKK
jgi:isopenicillin N synthase-like dioxygenase